MFNVIGLECVCVCLYNNAILFSLTLGKPKIKKQLKDVEVEEGKSLHLETEIYSEPEATVKWYKNGQECSADARLKITHDSKRYEEYSMTLNLCKVDDTGVYEVRAKNKVGESVSKCQVNILSKFYLRSGKNVSGFIDYSL